MVGANVLTGKRVLVVDAEEDVCGFLEAHLDKYKVETAFSFEGGKKLLENKSYAAAILDIVEVDGLKLLEVAINKSIPAIMLTANSIFQVSGITSVKFGSNLFIPKDSLYEIDHYLKAIFVPRQRGIKTSGNWLSRLSSYFDKKVGSGWTEKDKGFCEEFDRNFNVTKNEVTKIL